MFTHLHVHSEYSLLDGMCRIEPLVERASELGMEALALTDHGALYGAIQFYLACQEAGIKPIIGCEAYMAVKDHRGRSPEERNPYHIILLAQNQLGFQNLIQLITKAHLDGFYYKPRIDKPLLEAHHQGLIVLSACLNGEMSHLIQEGRQDEAKAAARWYKDVFGDNYYFEVQNHAIPELHRVNRELVGIGQELGIPLVATNDIHYIHQRNSYAHDVLLCIQTNATVHEEKRMRMADDSFYLKSPQEMAALFEELPEAIANTMRIAEKCDLRLELGKPHLPEFPTPPGKSPDEYLSELCWEGIRRRYPHVTQEMERRLSYELEVIRQTQFANYFLVVWDFVRYAREQGILYGVRGSAAASLALYCLGVTDIDPLAYNLVFERFLNVERKELPDIDMDFADDRRDEVIAYVAEKYGRDRVAQIITFGTMGARGGVRDVGRALGMPYSHGDRVARLVPPAIHITLERALEGSAELASLYREDEDIRRLVDTARELEGVARHASTHAAGIVISKEPLAELVPLQQATKGNANAIAMTQWAMEDVALMGLLKMDLLGLINLTILGKARDLIAQTRGIEIDLQHIPFDDPETFQPLSEGETTGVFQLESPGMRRYIRELKPTSLGDVAAMVALYRPGPMQHIPEFIEAKHGRRPVRFPHPALADILKDTYGVIVYQDQVLLIAQAFAGYSLGQADVMRKAMGKKIPEIMRQERERFIAGATAKGHTPQVAEEVFELIEPFAGYAFNKAHAFSYATIACQTAYLKAHFPAEYMAALFTCYQDWTEKIAAGVAECQRLGIPVLPPDVNHSGVSFTVEKTGDNEEEKLGIRFGLSTVKNVGEGAVAPLIASRSDGGPFKSLEDFCRRADLQGINKRALESLIKAGALDTFGNRGSLLAAVDRIMAVSQQEHRLKDSGQATMFGLWEESLPLPLPQVNSPEDVVTLSQREKLAWEKELLGVYMSQHPFSVVAQQAAQEGTTPCGQIDEEMVGETVAVAGVVTSVRQLTTRERKPFASAVLEDMVGNVSITVWPELYERTRAFWTDGSILLIRGRVTSRGGQVQIICDNAEIYQPAPLEQGKEEPGLGADQTTEATADGLRQSPAAKGRYVKQNRKKSESLPQNKDQKNTLIIRIAETEDEERDIFHLQEVMDTLERYPGKDRVRLEVVNGHGAAQLELKEQTIRYCSDLHEEMSRLVGEENLKVE